MSEQAALILSKPGNPGSRSIRVERGANANREWTEGHVTPAERRLDGIKREIERGGGDCEWIMRR